MILHDTFAATPLDRTSLPQGALDVAERVRTNPLPWTGQFSPQLVEKLLAAYAPRHGVVIGWYLRKSQNRLQSELESSFLAVSFRMGPSRIVRQIIHQAS